MSTQPRFSHRVAELALVLAVLVGATAISFLRQHRISYNSGEGWDGVNYHAMAVAFLHRQLPRGDAPFVHRIGTPFLASLVPTHNLLDAFLVINLLASVGTVFLLLAFFRIYLQDWRTRAVLIVLFVLEWHGPVRFVFYYPAYVDPVFLALVVASLLLLARLKSRPRVATLLGLTIVVMIGVVFREVMLWVAATVPFVGNPIGRSGFAWKGVGREIAGGRGMYLLPLLGGVLGLAASHGLATQTNSYSLLRAAAGWAFAKPLPSYLLAWFVTFGPVIAVLFHDIKDGCEFLTREQHLMALLVIVAVLGWIGGSDTERILFWGMPVVYLLVGRALERHAGLLRSAPLLFILCALQVVSERVVWSTPDYPNQFPHAIPFLTPIGERVPFLDLGSYWADRGVQLASLVEYGLCTLLILVWLQRRSVGERAGTTKGA